VSRVSIIGCGYVGLVTAAGLSSLGHEVTGIDRNEALVYELTMGQIRLLEPGLKELVETGWQAKLLTFSRSYESIATAEFVILAVDTPATPAGAANLSSIRSAVRSIASELDDSMPIIVNKSTSPIGTGDTIELLLRSVLAGRKPRIVSNPEFLREGSAVHDFLNPDRIVVGGKLDDAVLVMSLYTELPGKRLITDVRTAEMIKYASNTYLATRVSYINEIANLCHGLDISIDDVIYGLGLDPRIGSHFLAPGIGYGGSCLPKDVAALRYTADSVGISTPLLAAVEAVNRGQRTSVVRRLRERMGPLDDRDLAVWGVTFKAGIRDARESPAVDVIQLLINEGATVRVFDPAAPTNAPDEVRARYCATAMEAATGADALLVLTEWPDFREVSAHEVFDVMRPPHLVFDGRNCMSRSALEEVGFMYLGVGR